MDTPNISLDQLRSLRLQRLSGVTGGLSTTATPLLHAENPHIPPGMPATSSNTGVGDSAEGNIGGSAGGSTEGIHEGNIVGNAGGHVLGIAGCTAGPCTFSGDVLEMLKAIKDLLVALPEQLAAAISLSTQQAPATLHPAAATGISLAVEGGSAPLPPVASLPQDVEEAPAIIDEGQAADYGDVDLFADNGNEGSHDQDSCGVCHMAMGGAVYAFDKCGHYPFCSACINMVKKAPGPSACPYCKSEGQSLTLNLEE